MLLWTVYSFHFQLSVTSHHFLTALTTDKEHCLQNTPVSHKVQRWFTLDSAWIKCTAIEYTVSTVKWSVRMNSLVVTKFRLWQWLKCVPNPHRLSWFSSHCLQPMLMATCGVVVLYHTLMILRSCEGLKSQFQLSVCTHQLFAIKSVVSLVFSWLTETHTAST